MHWAGEGSCIRDSNVCKFIEAALRELAYVIRKGQETIDMQLDEMMQKKCRELHSIAGGAPQGAFWWENFEGSDLMEHFDSTLARLDIEQIVQHCAGLISASGEYETKRTDTPDGAKKASKTHIGQVLLRARVTQLEFVIFKTAKKSRKPSDRISTLLAEFNTESHMSGRQHALAIIGAPVSAWMKDKGYISASQIEEALEAARHASQGP